MRRQYPKLHICLGLHPLDDSSLVHRRHFLQVVLVHEVMEALMVFPPFGLTWPGVGDLTKASTRRTGTISVLWIAA